MPKKKISDVIKHQERYSTDGSDEVIVPAIEESASVDREVHVKGKVRVSKSVSLEKETISAPEAVEEIEIKRVPVDRVINEPAQVREAGNVTIIPLMEEVAIVTKQLVLREEIHLVRHVRKAEKSQEVTLRKEHIKVEKLPPK